MTAAAAAHQEDGDSSRGRPIDDRWKRREGDQARSGERGRVGFLAGAERVTRRDGVPKRPHPLLT